MSKNVNNINESRRNIGDQEERMYISRERTSPNKQTLTRWSKLQISHHSLLKLANIQGIKKIIKVLNNP